MTDEKPDPKSADSAAKSTALTELGKDMGWALVVLLVNMVILMGLASMPAISCGPGREACGWGRGCVPVNDDPQNCGGCDVVCSSGTCVYGECAE